MKTHTTTARWLAVIVILALLRYWMYAPALFALHLPHGDALKSGRTAEIAESLFMKAHLPPIPVRSYAAWPLIPRNARFVFGVDDVPSIRIDERLCDECSDDAIRGILAHEMGHYKTYLVVVAHDTAALQAMVDRARIGDIEIIADAFAVDLVGKEALYEALLAVHSKNAAIRTAFAAKQRQP